MFDGIWHCSFQQEVARSLSLKKNSEPKIIDLLEILGNIFYCLSSKWWKMVIGGSAQPWVAICGLMKPLTWRLHTW